MSGARLEGLQLGNGKWKMWKTLEESFPGTWVPGACSLGIPGQSGVALERDYSASGAWLLLIGDFDTVAWSWIRLVGLLSSITC